MTQPLAKPSPLGRGLSALFGDADASYTPRPATASTAPVAKAGPAHIPVIQLQPGVYQPRRHFDDAAIRELAESVKAHGILQPLLVRPLPGVKDSYEIIAGERRWRAAQLAGLHEVPAVVRELADADALEIALIENIQRQDLSPLEEAEGYKRLIAEFSHTQEHLAKIVGKSRSHIANMMRLLSLPAEVKKLIDDGLLSAGHARALVTAKNPLELAAEIVKGGLNVRQAEELAKSAAENPQTHKKKSATGKDTEIAALEKEISRLIGLKIEIAVRGATSGAVTIHYQTLDQLDGVLRKLRE